MTATGFVLDMIRWAVNRRRLTQNYWIKEVGKALSDLKYILKTRNLNRWWLLSTAAIFLFHGVLWVMLAPSEDRASASVFAQLCPEPRDLEDIPYRAQLSDRP